MKLLTERLLIRCFSARDERDTYEYMKQEDVINPTGCTAHRCIDDTHRLLRLWADNEEHMAIIWRENGRLIGHVSIRHPDGLEHRCELGYALHRGWHRLGIMTEALTAVLEGLFYGDMESVRACCFVDNIASRGLIEKLGFRFMGYGRHYSESVGEEMSCLVYGMERAEYFGGLRPQA